MRTEGATALFTSPALSGLTHLDLTFGRAGPEAIEALVAGTMTALTSLNLAHNPLGDRGARALARWPWPAPPTWARPPG
jgi:hypothetical protein